MEDPMCPEVYTSWTQFDMTFEFGMKIEGGVKIGSDFTRNQSSGYL